MKTLFTTVTLLFISILSFGQAQVGTVEFKNSKQPAAVLELPYAPDVVSDAIQESMKKKGKSKRGDLKGFTSYRNSTPSASDSIISDLFFKVERKSRKEKDISIVSLLLGMPKEAVTPGNTVHYITMDEAKGYLNELIPSIQAYNLEVQIKDQTNAVSKAESKYKNLLEDADDLQKKKQAIEKKIEDNKQDQIKQQSDVEAQKQKLAAMIAQRKL